MSGESSDKRPRKRAVTSEGLSFVTVVACWTISVLLLGCGIVATFVAGTGAAPSAMILFGSLFLVLALMRRVPLSLEVGGAKLDASYEVDEAYAAGRDIGRQLGVEDALTDVEMAKERGEPADAALQALRERLTDADPAPTTRRSDAFQNSADWPESAPSKESAMVGYRGPTACSAAGITYRQLDYWDRTGLLEPSVRTSSCGSQRLYSAHDILLLRVVKRLLDAGVSLQQIRTMIRHLRMRGPRELDQLVVMSDGDTLWETTSSEEVFELLQSGAGMFGVGIGGVERDLLAALADLPGEPAHPLPDDSP